MRINMKNKIVVLFLQFFTIYAAMSLAACGGGGGNASAPSSSSAPSGTANDSVASLMLVSSKTTLKADGVDSITLTLKALDSSNGVVKGASLKLSATSGLVLSASSFTTDATTGVATATVTADQTNQVNRTATLTLSCDGCIATNSTSSVTISGATLSLTGNTSLVAGGASVTLDAVVKDTAGNNVPDGTVVTFASTDINTVAVSSAIQTTVGGKASVNVSGVATTSGAGTPINVTALGAASSKSYTVSAPANALTIASPSSTTALVTNVLQTISVSAPGASSVNFSSTAAGSWSASNPVSVSSGAVTVGFTPSQAGVLAITVNDNLGRSATVNYRVSSPASAADKILLSTGQTTISRATGSTTPSVRITAQALDVVSPSIEQGVANVPIQFTFSGGPNAGEYLTPALAYTDSSGFAYADFFAGTAPTTAGAIVVHAQIQNRSIATGTSPSSNDINLTIGGQATSVSFGSSTVIRESSDKTVYMLDHSVQVTDAQGNAVKGAIVTLKVRPVAFSTGSACTITATYCSEDANGNGSLDVGEDGLRISTTVSAVGSSCYPTPLPSSSGSKDGILTPSNSYAGSVPATVTTGDDGTAAFSLTYLKAASIWTVVRLVASVGSGTTETSNSTVFRLAASKPDTDTCVIPPSPFTN